MFVRTSTPSAPSPAGVDAVFAFTCLPWSRAPSDPSPIPQSNCYAERLIPSVRSECFDRLLIYHRTARPTVLGRYEGISPTTGLAKGHAATTATILTCLRSCWNHRRSRFIEYR
jgi:hypothetical protein